MHRQKSKKTQHHFYFSSNALVDSCPLPKSNIKLNTNKHNNILDKDNNRNQSNNNVLTIEADLSMKLSEYIKKSKNHMEYSHAEKMIHCIGKQLHKLELNDYGIPSFNLDDITVFFIKKETNQEDYDEDDRLELDEKVDHNDKKNNIIYDNNYDIYFAITNDDKICEFTTDIDDADEIETTFNKNKQQELVIVSPFKKEYTTQTSIYQKNKAFISPEFEKFTHIKELPYHIHFKSGYYSFGLLCIYCLLTRKTPNMHLEKQEITQKEIEEIIGDINSNGGGKGNNNKGVGNESNKTDEISITSALHRIINTKIYWFLIRLLKKEPSERRYLCI